MRHLYAALYKKSRRVPAAACTSSSAAQPHVAHSDSLRNSNPRRPSSTLAAWRSHRSDPDQRQPRRAQGGAAQAAVVGDLDRIGRAVRRRRADHHDRRRLRITHCTVFSSDRAAAGMSATFAGGSASSARGSRCRRCWAGYRAGSERTWPTPSASVSPTWNPIVINSVNPTNSAADV